MFAFWKTFTRWATRPGPWDASASKWNAPVQLQQANFEAARSHAWPAMGEQYGVDLEDGGPPPRSWVSAPQGHGGYAADGLRAMHAEEDAFNAAMNEAMLKYTNGIPLSRMEEELLLHVELPAVQISRPRTGVGREVHSYDVPFSQATDSLPYVEDSRAALLEKAHTLRADAASMRVQNMRSALIRRSQTGDW